MKLTKRQNKILKAIVREYVGSAIPVSSKRLVKKYHFGVSSATMRNEMVALEEAGLILQRHTSAGRIPTDEGYRYFVDHLLPGRRLSKREQKKLTLELLKTKAEYNKLLRQVTKVLSELTGSVALAGLPDEEIFFDSGLRQLLKEPEFAQPEPLYEMAQIMEEMDEHIGEMETKPQRDLQVYIGNEIPLCNSQECAMIVKRFRLPSGERGVIALVGPKRMRYDRNMSLLNFLSKFLRHSWQAMILVGGTGALTQYLNTFDYPF